MPAPLPRLPQDAGDSRGTTPRRYESIGRRLTVWAALSPSSARMSPRYQRMEPSGWQTCSIWVRSLPPMLSPDDVKTTGPATAVVAVVHPPAPPPQSPPVSIRKLLGPTRTARAALAATATPFTTSLPLSCTTMVSKPAGALTPGDRRVSSTVMGSAPPATPERFPAVVLL